MCESQRNVLIRAAPCVSHVKGTVEEQAAELQVYNELKRRAEASTFKKDLHRNIQVCSGSPNRSGPVRIS